MEDEIKANTQLTRAGLARSLTDAGYPITEATLATKATRGGGPPYRIFSGRALYRWSEGLAWAESVTSAPRRSTSESAHQIAA